MRLSVKYALVAGVLAAVVLAIVALVALPLFTYVASISAVVVSVLSVYATVQDIPVLSFKDIRPRGDRLSVMIGNAPDAGKAIGCQGKVDIECGQEDILALDSHTAGLPVFLYRDNAPPGGIRSGSVVWERHPNPDRIDIDPDDDESLAIARVARLPEPVFVIFSEQGDATTQGGLAPLTRGRALLRARDAPYRVTVRVGASNLPRRIRTTFLLSLDSQSGSFRVQPAPPDP